MDMTLKSALLAAGAALLGGPTLALAQTADTSTAQQPVIEEVVVTAERRETSLQSTPIAITAVGADQIQKAGVTTILDLKRVAPTVTFSTSNGVPQIFVRGVGQTLVSLGGEGGVATHIDGVYLGRPVQVNSALYDLRRVEVLRGPQGTLYGRNATGGSINFITAGPTSTPEGYAILRAGNYNAFRFEGAAGGPLMAGVDARLAAMYDVRDGYVDNLVTGEPIGHPETRAARLSVRIAPEDAPFDLTVSADYLKTTGDAQAFKRKLSYNLPNSIAGGRFTDEPWKIYSTTDAAGDRELSGINATASWDLGWATLKSITSGRRNSLHRVADIDASDLFSFENFEGFVKAKQFSLELQLLSKTGGRLEWVAGAYFFDETSREQNKYFFALNLGTVAAPRVIPINLDLRARQYIQAYALFGQASYRITDQLRATVGLRYSDEDKKSHASNNGAIADLSAKFNAWTPKFGIEYTLEDTLLYASATRGFKAGGFNSSTTAQKFPFEPEYIWAYEFGAKRDWLDGRLRTNLALFHSKYTNLQVQQNINAVSVVTNAASAKINGAELEVTYRPIQNLTLNGAFSYLDTAYQRTNPPFQLVNGLPPGGLVDMSGKSLPFAPKFAFIVNLEYRHPTPSLGGNLVFNASHDWRDRTHLDVLAMPTENQGAYGLTDLRLAYERADRKLELAIFGRNIFDRHYYTTLLRSQPTINGPVGPEGNPRTFGAELKLRY
jgi:iron complex outermembrane receptor protein